MAQRDRIVDDIAAEVRREQWLRLWRRFRRWIIAGGSFVLLVFAGGVGYRQYQESERRDWGDAYIRTLDAVEQDNLSLGLAEARALKEESSGAYQALARLQEAALESRLGNRETAETLYDELQLYAPEAVLRQLASLLWAYNALDDGDGDAIRGRITPLLAEDSVWRPSALEIMAFLALREERPADAIGHFKAITEEAYAPQGIKGRAEDMLAYLGKTDDAPAGRKTNDAP